MRAIETSGKTTIYWHRHTGISQSISDLMSSRNSFHLLTIWLPSVNYFVSVLLLICICTKSWKRIEACSRHEIKIRWNAQNTSFHNIGNHLTWTHVPRQGSWCYRQWAAGMAAWEYYDVIVIKLVMVRDL
jgi:hypothetical protein